MKRAQFVTLLSDEQVEELELETRLTLIRSGMYPQEELVEGDLIELFHKNSLFQWHKHVVLKLSGNRYLFGERVITLRHIDLYVPYKKIN